MPGLTARQPPALFFFRFRPVQGGGEFLGVGEGLLFRGRQRLVRVGGHCHGGVGLVQRVPDRVFVATSADQDAHGGRVGGPAQFVVNQSNVELELAGEFGLELPGLQLDDHVAQLLHVEEQQVDTIPSWE